MCYQKTRLSVVCVSIITQTKNHHIEIFVIFRNQPICVSQITQHILRKINWKLEFFYMGAGVVSWVCAPKNTANHAKNNTTADSTFFNFLFWAIPLDQMFCHKPVAVGIKRLVLEFLTRRLQDGGEIWSILATIRQWPRSREELHNWRYRGNHLGWYRRSILPREYKRIFDNNNWAMMKYWMFFWWDASRLRCHSRWGCWESMLLCVVSCVFIVLFVNSNYICTRQKFCHYGLRWDFTKSLRCVTVFGDFDICRDVRKLVQSDYFLSKKAPSSSLYPNKTYTRKVLSFEILVSWSALGHHHIIVYCPSPI